jgi:hypothetical protein
MNHQNQIEQMANGAMFATETKKLVILFLRIYLFASLFIRALCIRTPEISQTSPDIHP